MYKQKIEQQLKEAILELGFVATDIVCNISENPRFGDYTTNIALQLSKQIPKDDYHSANDIANAILEKFGHPQYLERVEIAGPSSGGGFINFFLSDEALIKELEKQEIKKTGEQFGQRILVEFAQPNTHKAFHIGHLRNLVIGESVARFLEKQGNVVFRVTYGGDIGPHVAKALWGVLKLEDEYGVVKLKSLREKAEFLGKAYALGATSYETDPKVKDEVEEINRQLYASDPALKPLWLETKGWSSAYFDSLYARFGTLFDAQIWESEVQEEGVLAVEENTGKIFIKDGGAVIFKGEDYGLHNRVFITQAGYPTYEAKEIGLTKKEQELFPFDKSLHIVAQEQAGFFRVVTKALEMIDPSLKGKKIHLGYGMVNLKSGKMSSRTGEVVSAEALVEQVSGSVNDLLRDSNIHLNGQSIEKIALAAVKFHFLKFSLNTDINFDIAEAISLKGDSGPYVLYTYARIKSLINRAKEIKANNHPNEPDSKRIAQTLLEPEEREVLRQLEYFESIIGAAADGYKLNELCTYLLNLSKAFNRFYEIYPVVGSEQQDFRLALSLGTGDTIKSALFLLGVETVERM